MTRREKQGKQKTNKVEQKFKIGNWVVANDGFVTNNGESTFLITNITCNHYSLGDAGIISIYGSLEDTKGVVHYPCLLSERIFHTWTIKDAKDGDILYSHDKNLVWIYKDKRTYHIALILDYAQYNCITIKCDISIPSDTKPATKEQRDILFQTIEKAGYEWDAKNKEVSDGHIEIKIDTASNSKLINVK